MIEIEDYKKTLESMSKEELLNEISNLISDNGIQLQNKSIELRELKSSLDRANIQLQFQIGEVDIKNRGIEGLTEDWKQRINKARQRQFNTLKKEELASAYEKLIESLEDELERRQIDYTKLQKQVDELKEEKLSAICDLNMRIVELDNELKQAKTLLEFREETIKYLEDANIRYAEALENKVKDTAKEIFVEQKKFICNKWKQYMTENELIEFAEERYGVEL